MVPTARRAVTLLVCLSMWLGAAAQAAVRGPCSDALTQRIPPRQADAPGGHAFASAIEALSGDEREARIGRELSRGNLPDFLRHLTPVYFQVPRQDGGSSQLVICASPDYLAVGSDDDFLRVPVRLETALSALGPSGLTLPTPRIVDAIYAQATVHFIPQPLPAGDAMRSTAYYRHHNELIEAQRAAFGTPEARLSAGQKKDLVLTARLWQYPDRVAIYGWQSLAGVPIQHLSTVHGWRYVDYSHGARLISEQVFIDGTQRSLFDVLEDPRLAPWVSAEGVLHDVRALVRRLSLAADSAAAMSMTARIGDYSP